MPGSRSRLLNNSGEAINTRARLEVPTVVLRRRTDMFGAYEGGKIRTHSLNPRYFIPSLTCKPLERLSSDLETNSAILVSQECQLCKSQCQLLVENVERRVKNIEREWKKGQLWLKSKTLINGEAPPHKIRSRRGPRIQQAVSYPMPYNHATSQSNTQPFDKVSVTRLPLYVLPYSLVCIHE